MRPPTALQMPWLRGLALLGLCAAYIQGGLVGAFLLAAWLDAREAV